MFRSLRKATSFAAAALLLALAPAAFAHTHPEKMSPAADASVAAPASVTIEFSGDLEPKFSSITVVNATGHVVNTDPSKADAKTMTVALPPLPAGIYTVDWTAVSVDSHRSKGEYKFTVK
jgi:methionine-rich copper-binding protein CopC